MFTLMGPLIIGHSVFLCYIRCCIVICKLPNQVYPNESCPLSCIYLIDELEEIWQITVKILPHLCIFMLICSEIEPKYSNSWI